VRENGDLNGDLSESATVIDRNLFEGNADFSQHMWPISSAVLVWIHMPHVHTSYPIRFILHPYAG
jgi:hypothetical protein